jgi:D-beta-D-heptose 7-phosphate kinase / D-beta-D-heptose 1-phosphate adenosyltransferase
MFTCSELADVLNKSRRASVLVVGDLMLDEYLYGTIDRISPEAPVGILEWRSLQSTLGGAANVASNLAKLGCHVFLSGVVGDDQKGEELLGLAEQNGISVEGVWRAPGRPTTVKTRIISNGHQVLRIDREVRTPIQSVQAESIVAWARSRMPHVDGVILSDYAKGVLGTQLCQSLIKAARENGLRVLVDPKGQDFSKYRGAFLLTPNKKELREAAHLPVESETQFRQAVTRIFADVQCDAVLVTRSEEGMSLFTAGGSETHIQTEVRDIFDITGAGDTVISMLARVLFAGNDLQAATRLANIAAAVKINKLGTVGVEPHEVMSWLQQRESHGNNKIVEYSQLKQLLSLAHSQGKKVAFTNGCFDLLHVGHVQFLQDAKALGQILVVAINDDASTTSIKGAPRPLISAADRARVIAALEPVDYVTIFSDLTPLRLIEQLRPDILVKGGDYELSDVVGRKEVESYGGRVELIPITYKQSTSAIARNIASRYHIAR